MPDRDEIMDMPAGRELDVLVGIRLFGWDERMMDLAKEGALDPFVDEYGEVAQIGPPLYSTDIAAAWEVVDHMESLGFSWYAGYPWTVDRTPLVSWRFARGSSMYRADEEGVPLAICRASLLALTEAPSHD